LFSAGGFGTKIIKNAVAATAVQNMILLRILFFFLNGIFSAYMFSDFIILVAAKNRTIAGGRNTANSGGIAPLSPIALNICMVK
jgi:hypothetical protein